MDPRGYCVCTSYGKDSVVLGHLYRRAGVKHFYARSITGIDPPELVYFARQQEQALRDAGYLVYALMYGKSFWRMITDHGVPPLRRIRYCCAEFKERRHETTYGCLMSMGVRKAESTNRAKNRNELEIIGSSKSENIIMPFDDGENRKNFEICYKDRERRLNPLAYWDDTDVWDYIHENKISYCCLYDEGFERLGCIGCPMARERCRRTEYNRWPGYKRLMIKTLDRVIEMRKQAGLYLLNAAKKSGEEWFEWWLSDTAQTYTPPEGQEELEEG
jgi:phosphoadenosine phosphosulfate reductase